MQQHKIIQVMTLSLFIAMSGIAANFELSTGITKFDIAYKGGIDNIAFNTHLDEGEMGTFHAGEFWNQVWTRDGSYAIEQAAALISPTVSKGTFLYTAKRESYQGKDIAYQDICGHFGGWPALTDAVTYAPGVWQYIRVTRDVGFISYAYDVLENTLARAEAEVFDAVDGLFKGCSSFMESNSGYPEKYANNGDLVAQTKAGSTNMLHYKAYLVVAELGKLLGKDQTVIDAYLTKAAALKIAINKELWMPDKGYYAYIKDENGNWLEEHEGLGSAFAILYDIADSAKCESIFKNMQVSDFGVMCLYPQYQAWSNYTLGDAMYYHTGMIWPFVQGYWAWAASDKRKTDVFMYELDKCQLLYSLSAEGAKTGEFREFYRPEAGEPDGGGRQLWSATGYISMINHGLFGMDFQLDGIHFNPLVPDAFTEEMTLKNIPYQGMNLSVSVVGPGKYVHEFYLDSILQEEPVVPFDLTGEHTVKVVVGKNPPIITKTEKPKIQLASGSLITTFSGNEIVFRLESQQNFNLTLNDLSGKVLGTAKSSSGEVRLYRNNAMKNSLMIASWKSEHQQGKSMVYLQNSRF
ncbi:MAG: hypothetical protein HQK83_18955 [Fibrobacteria bacterium]|nr:hypothetical protein [Fibrobacteria bacterium]